MVLNAELKSINITLRVLLSVGKACVQYTENGIIREDPQSLQRSACSSPEVCHLNRVKNDTVAMTTPGNCLESFFQFVCECACLCVSYCVSRSNRKSVRKETKKQTHFLLN